MLSHSGCQRSLLYRTQRSGCLSALRPRGIPVCLPFQPNHLGHLVAIQRHGLCLLCSASTLMQLAVIEHPSHAVPFRVVQQPILSLSNSAIGCLSALRPRWGTRSCACSRITGPLGRDSAARVLAQLLLLATPERYVTQLRCSCASPPFSKVGVFWTALATHERHVTELHCSCAARIVATVAPV